VDGLRLEHVPKSHRAFYTHRQTPSRIPISSFCQVQSNVRESLTTDFVCMSVGIIAFDYPPWQLRDVYSVQFSVLLIHSRQKPITHVSLTKERVHSDLPFLVSTWRLKGLLQ
jgi:hypothetical protein